MHAVIRKRQGLPWEKEQPKGLHSNLKHLSTVAAIPNFEPLPAETLSIAHGALAYPKLVREIGAPLLVLRQKALRHTLETMCSPRHIASFLAAGVVPALNVACADSDEEVRTLATCALARIAREELGRQAMLPAGSVAVLLGCAADQALAVRLASVEAVRELARTNSGTRALIDHGFVKLLCERCRAAPDGGAPNAQLQCTALHALRQACQVESGHSEAISCGAVSLCVAMLAHEMEEAREQAAYSLAVLTVGQQEKAVALKESVMTSLLKMLHPSASVAVKTAGAATLMTMTNGTRFPNGDNACKHAAVTEGAVSALVPLLQDGLALELGRAMDHATSALTVYVTKCIANLADHPLGRKQLQPALADLQPLAESDEPLVRKHAAIAIERVKWEP